MTWRCLNGIRDRLCPQRFCEFQVWPTSGNSGVWDCLSQLAQHRQILKICLSLRPDHLPVNDPLTCWGPQVCAFSCLFCNCTQFLLQQMTFPQAAFPAKISHQDLGAVCLHFSKSNSRNFNSLRAEQSHEISTYSPSHGSDVTSHLSWKEPQPCWCDFWCPMNPTVPAQLQSCLSGSPDTPSQLPYSPLSMAGSRIPKHGDKLNFASLMLRVSPGKSRKVSWKAPGKSWQ